MRLAPTRLVKLKRRARPKTEIVLYLNWRFLCFQVIQGNTNTYLESKHELEPPLWASKIRFLPYSYHRRTVCMRVELYGCYWSGKLFALANFRETCRGPVQPPDCPLTLIPACPEQICFSKSCSYNSVFARKSNYYGRRMDALNAGNSVNH